MKRTIKVVIVFLVFIVGGGTYSLNAQNPPSHAKAHGVKKKYKYYPDSNVYFDLSTKQYTYLKSGKWSTVITLPSSIKLIGNGNDFDFDGDNPWKENSKHKSQYKSSKTVKSSDVKKIDNTIDSKSNNGNGKKKK